MIEGGYGEDMGKGDGRIDRWKGRKRGRGRGKENVDKGGRYNRKTEGEDGKGEREGG